MSSDNRAFRLRKLNDTEVYGPMNVDELRQLIDSAYVSPEDEIATEEDNWKPITEFTEFGMVWKILALDGTHYGPTSLGTIREFVRTGEVRFEDKITQKDETDALTVAEVLGEKVVTELKAEIEAVQSQSTDAQLETAFETVREIRIRTLEADLQHLHKEYDELKQKYLKACETLAKSR